MKLSKIFNLALVGIALIAVVATGFWINHWANESRVLKQIIGRLSADSRVAEVLVTKSEFNEETSKIQTTIKFLEFDSESQPLAPKYFTFRGNVIQFQSLVIRFKDELITVGDKLRGKSVYLFMKAFVLDDKNTQVFDITEAHQIPSGYKIPNRDSQYEKEFWGNFWSYALDPRERQRAGIKNAQIEAPGSLFLPGTIYTIRIEHDGGLRIDNEPIPEILRGEKM